MATLKRQISYFTSILLWPKNYYWREQTAGISDGNKKVSRRIWKWLSVCAAEIHREIDESLVVLNTFLFQIKRVSLFWPKKISFRTKLTFDFFLCPSTFLQYFLFVMSLGIWKQQLQNQRFFLTDVTHYWVLGLPQCFFFNSEAQLCQSPISMLLWNRISWQTL